MIKSIRQKAIDLREGDSARRLMANFFSLTALQALNYLIPLITLPYLVRVLGVEKFGLLSFATATVSFLMVLTDYGFNLSATRSVSVNRSSHEKLVEIFSSVLIIKLLLAVVSLLLLSVLLHSSERFRADALVYIFSFGVVIGQALFPVWFFQGMERMKFITYVNVATRILCTALVFILVRSEDDYLIVPILTSLGAIAAGVWSLYLVKSQFGLVMRAQPLDTLMQHFSDGWHIFLSTVAVNVYTASVTFILGLMTSDAVVGYFSAAEKLMRAFKSLLVPVSQTLYPFLNEKISRSPEEGFTLIRKLALFVFVFSACISLLVFLCAEELVVVILGEGYKESVPLLRAMAVIPLAVGLSNVFGVQTMLTFGRKRAFSIIVVSGSMLSLLLSFMLIPPYEDIGAAYTLAVVECFIAICMLIYLQCSGFKFIGRGGDV